MSPAISQFESGVIWEEPIRITESSHLGDWHPQIAATGDTVHIVWYRYDESPQVEQIYYTRSLDGGDTWQDITLLSDTAEYVRYILPKIAVSGDTVYVVYEGRPLVFHNVHYIRSTDAGETWENDTVLAYNNGLPSIYVDGNNLFIVYYDYGWVAWMDPITYLIKSFDGGETWSNPDTVIADCTMVFTNIVSNNDVISLLGKHRPYTSIEIYYTESHDGGETWSLPYMISHDDTISSQRPVLAVDFSGKRHTLWYDYKYSPYPYTGDLFYRKKNNNMEWEEILTLTEQPTANYPAADIEGEYINLVFDDMRNTDMGLDDFNIYYKQSRDLGISWSYDELVVDFDFVSLFPDIAIEKGHIHITWSQDTTDDVFAIYYMRGNYEPLRVEEENHDHYPNVFHLAQNFPNPFNDRTIIGYRIYKDVFVELTVFNINGNEVKRLVNQHKTAGSHTAYWDGTNINNIKVGSGIYLIELKTEGFRDHKKCVYLR